MSPYLGITLVFGLALLSDNAACAQANLALLDSPAGDYIGAGQLHYTTDPGLISVRGNAQNFTVDAFGFSFWFDGPDAEALRPGSYPNAIRTPFNDSLPGLSISGNGRGCNQVSASFEIKELETDGDGSIQRLWVTFSHSCEGTMPAATGELRLNSATAPATPEGRVLRVPQDYATIQSAISGAQVKGDIIEVGPGTYVGPVSFSGKRFRLVAVSGPAVTTIQGVTGSPAVRVSGGQDATATLEGFTIQGGTGGILIEGSAPTILGNVITNCGYGINAQFASPTVVSNVIVGSWASPSSGLGNGSGIHMGGAAQARIERNFIQDNLMGITCFAAGTPFIRNNIIQRNREDGINLVNLSDADIVQNLIISNGASGIAWLVGAGGRGPFVLHNTFVGNGVVNGAAIAADGYDVAAEIRNNLIVGKVGIYCGGFNDLNAPVIRANNVFSPTGQNYAGQCPDMTGTEGNIAEAPRFLDAEGGDYRPQADSPGLDAGAPIVGLATDFDGLPRVVPRDGNSLGVPDMGAFEYPGRPPLPPRRITGVSLADRIVVTWDHFDGARSYALRRSEEPAGESILLMEGMTNRWEDTTVIAGRTYSYVVLAYGLFGGGPPSRPLVVRAGNRPPAAQTDQVTLDEDTVGSFKPLANDIDPDGDALTFDLLSLPTRLHAVRVGETITLSPDPEWSGTEEFTYLLRDVQGLTATGRVTVAVRPVNDPPTVSPPGIVPVLGNQVAAVTMSGLDPDSSELTVEVMESGQFGVAQAVPGQSRFTYQPAHGFVGRDTVVVRLTDGGAGSEPVLVTIDVRRLPDLDGDGMSDAWENVWDLNNPLADPDGDGQINRDEYAALTSPRDPDSRLVLKGVAVSTNGIVRVNWASRGGVRYRVQSADDGKTFTSLERPAAIELDPAPYGTPSEQTFVDVRPPSVSGARLYRVITVTR